MFSLGMLADLKRLIISATIIIGAIAFSPLNKNPSAQTNNVDGGALTLQSDIQEANSETGVITARGNVQIYYPARKIQATAAQAQYFSREARLVLSGDVYVLQNGNSMRAEKMTYLIDEGRFIATPKLEQQVESIYFIPESALSPARQAQPQLNLKPRSDSVTRPRN